MRRALDLAREAAAAGEVPVGAVVTRGDAIIAEARNAMRGSTDPTAHAEMVAIRAAAAALGTSRLDDCTLWVTPRALRDVRGGDRVARFRRSASAPKTRRAAGSSTARGYMRSRPAIIGPTSLAGSAKRKRELLRAFLRGPPLAGRASGGFRRGGSAACLVSRVSGIVEGRASRP